MGRNKVKDKVMAVTIYVKKSKIKEHGGISTLKDKLKNFVESAPFVIVHDL